MKLQGKLDSNTNAISEIAKEISRVSISTNKISNIIKNEQKEKGKLKLKVSSYDTYIFNIASNNFHLSRETLELGFDFRKSLVKIPLIMRIVDENLLIETMLRDKDDNLLLQIVDNEWSLNKNYAYSINFDESGMEVINNEGLIIFQLSLVENKFQIMIIMNVSGLITFVNPTGYLHNVTYKKDFGTEIFQNHLLEHKYLSNRLFKHYGEDYLGKRLEK